MKLVRGASAFFAVVCCLAASRAFGQPPLQAWLDWQGANGQTEQSAGTGIDAAARTIIAKANADWLEGMKRQDLAAISEAYDDAAVFVTATGESVRGRGAIEQLMRDRFEKTGRITAGRIVQDGITAAGSLIYEWGHADLETTKAGTVRGRYLTVWHKNAAGRWCIARNMSLPD